MARITRWDFSSDGTGDGADALTATQSGNDVSVGSMTFPAGAKTAFLAEVAKAEADDLSDGGQSTARRVQDAVTGEFFEFEVVYDGTGALTGLQMPNRTELWSPDLARDFVSVL